MVAPRNLPRPPITEALVDIRAKVARSPEEFQEFAKTFKDRFPKIQTKHGLRAELRVEQGRLLPPATELLSFEGVRVESEDGTLIVQFRPDGFTLNNLRTYVGGDALISDAIRYWSEFAKQMEPTDISRAAFRYINALNLPLNEGDTVAKFLAATPPLPIELKGTVKGVSEFLCRTVSHTSDTTVLAITQRFRATETTPDVIIDIDVSENRAFSGDVVELQKTLEALRVLRNQAFFALLTESTVNLYL
jgi:uncharacterized protein (TIGR04255 family)